MPMEKPAFTPMFSVLSLKPHSYLLTAFVTFPGYLTKRHLLCFHGRKRLSLILAPCRLILCRFLRVQVRSAAGGAAEDHRLRVRGRGRLQLHPRAGAVLQPQHRHRALLLGGQQLLPEEQGSGRHLRLHRHRHPHHRRPKFFRLLLPRNCKCRRNINDWDWDRDRRNNRGNPRHLHARHGNGHYHRDNRHRVRRPRSNRHEQHGHRSGGFASKGWSWTGCLPGGAPLPPGIRVKFDPEETVLAKLVTVIRLKFAPSLEFEFAGGKKLFWQKLVTVMV